MFKKRIKIPIKLENNILYKAAKTCCVCRNSQQPVEVHHIDKNPANNVEENLVVVCKNCHDEAHATRALSKSLTASRLQNFKHRWEAEVAARSREAMLPSSNLRQAMWTFVNHQRLPSLMQNSDVKFERYSLMFLIKRGVVDRNGIPIFQLPATQQSWSTIYNRFQWDDSQRIHQLYIEAVDNLIRKVNPIELGAIWTKTEIKAILRPGMVCFCMRGFHFGRADIIDGEEDRLVYARAKNIEVRFHANTRHMYGNSALCGNFSGHRFAAVLLLVKEIVVEGKLLVIMATPIAMGAGFVPSEYHTPHSLRYGWARRMPSIQNESESEDGEVDELDDIPW